MLIVEGCDGRQHVCACMSPGEHRPVRQDGRDQVIWSALLIKSVLFIGMMIGLLCPQTGHSAEDGL